MFALAQFTTVRVVLRVSPTHQARCRRGRLQPGSRKARRRKPAQGPVAQVESLGSKLFNCTSDMRSGACHGRMQGATQGERGRGLLRRPCAERSLCTTPAQGCTMHRCWVRRATRLGNATAYGGV